MSPLHRRLACLALMVAIGGCGQATGQPAGSPAATLTADPPSVSPSPIARPLRHTGDTAILDPGTYVLDYFPTDLAFDIPVGDPPGWHVGKSTPDVAIVLWYTPPEITYVFGFWNVDNVYVDPCDAGAGLHEPPIGPSVDDLVDALSALPGFEASAPADVTVGAFRGKEIQLTAVGSEQDCPAANLWSAGSDITDLAPGETLAAQILDVDGVRIVVTVVEPDQPDAAAEAELQQTLDSIRMEPAT